MLQEISFLLMQEPRGSSFQIHSSSEVQMEGEEQILITAASSAPVGRYREPTWRTMLLLFQAI